MSVVEGLRAAQSTVNRQQSPDGATGIDITSAFGKQGNSVKLAGCAAVGDRQ